MVNEEMLLGCLLTEREMRTEMIDPTKRGEGEADSKAEAKKKAKSSSSDSECSSDVVVSRRSSSMSLPRDPTILPKHLHTVVELLLEDHLQKMLQFIAEVKYHEKNIVSQQELASISMASYRTRALKFNLNLVFVF